MTSRREEEPPTGNPTPSLVARLLSGDGVHLRDLPDDASPSSDDGGGQQGRYEIFGEIARGGIGIVLNGRDEDLGRGVAVKVLQDRYREDTAAVQRFIEEAQIGGQLQHPGIVPVYDLGEHDGRPFFAMKLIRGRTLRDMLAERNELGDELPRMLTIFEAVCQTLGYAHARGVAHRDLKPDNVMVGQFGEVQVVDWGIAKVLDRELTATPTEGTPATADTIEAIETVRSKDDTDASKSLDGEVMGTPAYMPPEQARGDAELVDERSDVFGLGAILCEILTGKPPFRGRLIDATIGDVGKVHERLRQSGADDELVGLACDCLAAEPEDRPANGKVVADRVTSYRANVEERARDAMLRAAEARVRAKATIGLTLAAVAVVALAVGSWLYVRFDQERRQRDAELRLDGLLDDASTAAVKARSASKQQLSLWTEAVDAAMRAATAADDEDVGPAMRERARSALDRVRTEQTAAERIAAQRRRERAMLARLEHARIPTSEHYDKEPWRREETRRLIAALGMTFDEYTGLSVAEADPAGVAEALRGGIDVELATYLDLWAITLDSAPAAARKGDTSRRLRTIAGMLDAGDTWRSELRTLLASGTDVRKRLEQMAATASDDDLTISGLQLLAEGLFAVRSDAAALEIYRRGHALHPHDFGICYRLGILHALFDNWSQTIAHMRVARSLRPDASQPRHLLGKGLFDTKQFDEALEVFTDLAERIPESTHIRYHLANTHFMRADYAKARAIVDGVLAEEPQNRESLLLRGQIVSEMDGAAAALPLMQQAVAANPRDAFVRVRLGLVLLRLNRSDEALAQLLRARALKPDNVLYLTTAAQSLVQVGQAERAVAVLREGMPRCLETAELHATLGDALLDSDDVDGAEQAYRRAIAIGGFESTARTGLGDVFTQRRRPQQALAQYRWAMRCQPREPRVDLQMVLLLLRLGRTDAALTHAELALRDPAATAEHLEVMGSHLTDAGHADIGERIFRRVVELSPESAHARYLLGNALYGQRRYREAILEYRQALPLDNQHLRAAINLSSLLEYCGHYGQALTTANQLAERHPDVIYAHLNVARLGTIVGALSASEQALARAERLIADDVPQPGGIPSMDIRTVQAALAKTSKELANVRSAVLGESGPIEQDDLRSVAFLALRMDRYARALDLFERSFAATESDDLRGMLAAARAALLAQATDATSSDDERATLRSKALAWLERVSADTDSRKRLREGLKFGDFDYVRGALLAKLPAPEQQRWRELWQRLD